MEISTPELVEDLDKAAHVGPLKFLRQVYEQIKKPHCMLAALVSVFYRNGISKPFYTNLVDWDVSSINLILDIWN